MPTYQNIIDSIKTPKECLDKRIYLLKEIEKITGFPLLVYVSDFRKPDNIILPEDKTYFSDLVENITSERVDILINSPGGLAEVTEAIVRFLRSKFTHIRFIVPNCAKSAATLMVLSGDEILMDYRSELGPIDPQVQYPSLDGFKREAAEDILDGFEDAKEALKKEGPNAIPAYTPLLSKYTIGLLRGCSNAILLSKKLAVDWLRDYMYRDEVNCKEPESIMEYFSSHKRTLSHNRAIGIGKCIQLKMKIMDLSIPDNEILSKKIWELWCLYELHFERSPAIKIFENSFGCTLQKQLQQLQVISLDKPIPNKA